MLRTLFHARSGRLLFPGLLFLTYAVLPFVLNITSSPHIYFRELVELTLVAVIVIVAAAFFPLPALNFPKLMVRSELFLLSVFVTFSIFILVVSVTAERIPLVASLQGADTATIAVLRERFLKAREGWQSSFVYINALFAGFLMPYCLALMFLHRYKLRWVCFSLFLLYTISFAEKAFFFKAVLPILYLIIQRRIESFVKPRHIFSIILGLLFVVTLVSGVGNKGEGSSADFFSADYVPEGPFDYMMWRSFAIPLVTAADALKVFDQRLDGQWLNGMTSTPIAALTGRAPVAFERMVFAEQWGQNETATGSANSVYLTEAYVNFGLTGLVFASLLVGLILRYFAYSRDEAFQSLWMLFCLNIFFAGLIGTLLSNGFLLLMLPPAFLKFKGNESFGPESTRTVIV